MNKCLGVLLLLSMGCQQVQEDAQGKGDLVGAESNKGGLMKPHIEFTIDGYGVQHAPGEPQPNFVYDAKTKDLRIQLFGYLAPDKESKVLDLKILEFDKEPGLYKAMATYERTDGQNHIFKYNTDLLEVDVTKFKVDSISVVDSTKSGMVAHTTISGTFSGNMVARVQSPELNDSPLAMPIRLHGSFSDVVLDQK